MEEVNKLTFHERLSRIREKLFSNESNINNQVSYEGLIEAAHSNTQCDLSEYDSLMINRTDFHDVSIIGRGQFAEVRLVLQKNNDKKCFAMKQISKINNNQQDLLRPNLERYVHILQGAAKIFLKHSVCSVGEKFIENLKIRKI